MNKRKWNENIMQYVLWLFMTIYLFVSVFNYAEFAISQIQAQYMVRIQNMGRTISREVKDHIMNSENLLSTLAVGFSEYEDLHSEEAINNLKLISKRTDFERLWLGKPDGYCIAASGETGNAFERDYFQDALKGNSGISQVQISSVVQEKDFTVYAPIYRDGRINGVIIGIYMFDKLEDTINIKCFDGKGYLQVFNSDGEILINSKHKSAYVESDNLFDCWSKVKFKGDKTLEDIKGDLDARDSSLVSFEVDGEEVYGYYCAVGIHDWFIFASIPAELIWNDSRESILSASMLCLKFIICIIMVFVVHFTFKNRKLKRMAEYDALTEIYNRGTIEKEIRKILKEEPEHPHLLALFDIDKFKSVNDTFGHIMGDVLLQEIAATLRKEFAYEAKIGRFGGDEFVVFVENSENFDKLKRQMQVVCAKVKEISEEKCDGLPISLSVGVAQYNKDADNFEELYKIADSRLYTVKKNGGNGIRNYDK